MFSRDFRKRGPLALKTYLTAYKVGDIVDVKVQPRFTWLWPLPAAFAAIRLMIPFRADAANALEHFESDLMSLTDLSLFLCPF